MSDKVLISDLIKPGTLVRLPPDASVTEASRKMMEHHIGMVLVESEDGTAVGVVTERDINFRVVARSRNAAETLLGHIMSRDPVLIAPDTNVFDGLRQVVNNFFRYAVIGTDRHAIGVVPVSVIFAEVTKAMGRDIAEIERMIRGEAFD